MTCRRKTRTEKEIIADVKKMFEIKCKNCDCNTCEYNDSNDCLRDYLLNLFSRVMKEMEDEDNV